MSGKTIGLVGAGAMGSALAASWQAAGHRTQTCLAGRSSRTGSFVRATGMTVRATLEDVVAADIVVSTVPPAAARSAALDIAAAASRVSATPLVVDLNAVSPTTVEDVARTLAESGLDLVDGVISGKPPQPGGSGTMMYVSGPRANEVAELRASWLPATVLGDRVGAASALKMSTASMYKGTNALVIQALLTAAHFGVLDAFLRDVSRVWPQQVPHWPLQTALAASKSERFADEMREIAATQAQAGLTPELFLGVAEVFTRTARTALAVTPPEEVSPDVAVETVLRLLHPKPQADRDEP